MGKIGFKIILKLLIKEKQKKCPYCDWSTIDINNKSWYFQQHILKEHSITPKEHLKVFPDDLKSLQTLKNKMNVK